MKARKLKEQINFVSSYNNVLVDKSDEISINFIKYGNVTLGINVQVEWQYEHIHNLFNYGRFTDISYNISRVRHIRECDGDVLEMEWGKLKFEASLNVIKPIDICLKECGLNYIKKEKMPSFFYAREESINFLSYFDLILEYNGKYTKMYDCKLSIDNDKRLNLNPTFIIELPLKK